MNNEYEAFCITNPHFYDTPAAGSPEEAYGLADRSAPEGWQRKADDHWVIFGPEDSELPSQGWKIHVSGCLDNAERIIETVWTYCVPRDITFKFLYSPRVLLARNAKYAGRGGSGKLVTVYPQDEVELELICKELDEALTGEPGPYILSDLRWASGPLHVRYGGFAPRYCTDDRGENVLAIEDSSGALVPDVRGPVFSVPAWVTPPDCLGPHLEARNAVTVGEIAYRIDEALHFSNGGGVYLGTHRRTGDKVVLKEARPHAGLSGDGADAVARLRRERDVLERLAGIEAIPRLLDFFAVGEHQFLVMEYVEGEALNKELVQRCPLLATAPGHAELAAYAEWALTLHGDVERAIAAIHGRGVVYGDLHMFNVIVRSDGTVALIDFEVADDLDAGRRPGLGAVGFAAPRDRRGADIDRYALACLKLALFLPLEPLITLDRAKAAELAEVVAEHFPLPAGWLDDAVRVITGPPESQAQPEPQPVGKAARPRVEPDRSGWLHVRDSITKAILASATPDRDDRLFPGDVAQFNAGGLNIAHGAAGVLYALDVVGAGRFPQYEEWLIRHAEEPPDGTRLGFYDGMHGVAHVLAHLDHHDAAARALDMCLGERWEESGDDLFGGIAGIGLNLAHMADVVDDAALHDAALRATEILADRLGSVDDVATTSGGEHPYAGLMRGSAGRALLFIRMFERTGEPTLLDHAATALRQDLWRCVQRDDGQLHVDEGWRTMPYLDVGSVGIGLVLARYLAHRDDDEMAADAAAIRGAACSLFYSQPGLFSGRAGMVLYLSDRCRSRLEAPAPETESVSTSPPRSPGDPLDAALAAQIRRLDWHALSFAGHMAFPGNQLLRLSMDLATGSAGVLLALGAALHDRPVGLPFLTQGLTGPQEATEGR